MLKAFVFTGEHRTDPFAQTPGDWSIITKGTGLFRYVVVDECLDFS